MRRALLVLLFGVCVASATQAGTYFGSIDVDPFIIVHPATYDGTGGAVQLDVCATPETRVATLSAIDAWNALERTTDNCTACRMWEEGASNSGDPNSMESVMLHEMGHCALALDHIEWVDNGGIETSFTSGTEIGFYTEGADGIRGSSDDGVSPPAVSRVTHWFRIADNDPFVIDSTMIDISTYSRQKIDFPTGHSWSASGNSAVGLLLSHPNTQAVMYGFIDASQRYDGLAADDVNTAEFGMSGLDETAGTADDYTVELGYVESCATAAIEVRYIPLGPDGVLGRCRADITSLAPPIELDIHWALIPPGGEPRVVLEINSDKNWDFSVFVDGFESGDTSGWSLTVP